MWNGGYFGSIPAIQARLPRATSKSERLRNSLVSGTLGGFIGTVLNTPLDVVKTRIQNANFESKVGGVAIIRDMIRNEGLLAFFKGLTPKVLVVGPKLVFSFTLAQSLIPWFGKVCMLRDYS